MSFSVIWDCPCFRVCNAITNNIIIAIITRAVIVPPIVMTRTTGCAGRLASVVLFIGGGSVELAQLMMGVCITGDEQSELVLQHSRVMLSLV